MIDHWDAHHETIQTYTGAGSPDTLGICHQSTAIFIQNVLTITLITLHVLNIKHYCSITPFPALFLLDFEVNTCTLC